MATEHSCATAEVVVLQQWSTGGGASRCRPLPTPDAHHHQLVHGSTFTRSEAVWEHMTMCRCAKVQKLINMVEDHPTLKNKISRDKM